MDTRRPEQGFTCYFVDDDGEVTTFRNDEPLPEGKTILRIAATGNHFMSVRSHPAIEAGML